MPLLTLIYLASSLDKSNLGNAKSLGMMKDLGKDPSGDTYALLNSLYYVSYAPFSKCHQSEGRKRCQGVKLTHCSGAFRLAWKAYTHGVGAHFLRSSLGYRRNVLCGSPKLLWRFCVQVLHRTWRCVDRLLLPILLPVDVADTTSEAGFSPLIQVFLSRFYAREKLGTRVAVWLAMAPLG
jgi:hypothetical protein